MLSNDLRKLAEDALDLARDVGRLSYRDCETLASILRDHAAEAAALERQTVPVASRQRAEHGRTAIYLVIDNTAARPAPDAGREGGAA